MKKTQWIELLYNIKHTIVSFVALVLFVTLATGLFTGIKWTVNSLDQSVEASYTGSNYHHFTLSYPYGFDDSFVDSLISRGIADEAEGYYETYRNIRQGSTKYQVKILSLTESIDRPYLISGKLPKSDGEIAVNCYFAEENGIEIGDVINFEKIIDQSGLYLNAISNKDMEALIGITPDSSELTTDSFKVTALIESAEFIGRYADTNGMSPNSFLPIKTVMFASEESFVKEAFPGYSKVALRNHKLDEFTTVSDEYKDREESIKAELESMTAEYALEKNADMKDASELMGMGIAEDYEILVSPREANGSFVGIHYLTDTFGKLQYSLVILFVIIELLVCYSTVSRLVYDQSVMTGTKKAMGLFSSEILKPFLIYSGIAVVIGAFIGVLLGRFIVEPVGVNAVGDTYRFHEIVYCLKIEEALIFAGIQLVLIIAVAFVASVSVSKRPALKLLNGMPPASKVHKWLEKLPLFNRASLINKTIIQNCLNDRRRVFATLIGVMGCTALIVCALSGYNNIYGSFDLNMDKVSRYDTEIHFSGDEKTKERLESLFDEAKAAYSEVDYSIGTMKAGGEEQLITELYAVNNNDFYEFLHLNDAYDGTEKYAENGAWVNIGYAKHFGAKIGDKLHFTDALGQTHEFTIEGFHEFYLMNYQIVIPANLYEEEFGVPCCPDMFVLRTDDSDFDEYREEIIDLEDGLALTDFYTEKRDVFNSVASIASAVLVMYLLLSVILAFLLLLNLFTMFVNEKKTELITLIINGFPIKEARKYISTDTVFLAIIGILAGIALGSVMGEVSLEAFNNNATYFLYRFSVKACVMGSALAFILTMAMCRIATGKIKKFKLSDINKI